MVLSTSTSRMSDAFGAGVAAAMEGDETPQAVLPHSDPGIVRVPGVHQHRPLPRLLPLSAGASLPAEQDGPHHMES